MHSARHDPPPGRSLRARRSLPERGPLAFLLALCACHSVDARAWNLGQLHKDDSRHQYSSALEGNLEYFLRHTLVGSFRGAGAKLADKAPAKIDDPASECLDNLIALDATPSTDPRTCGIQVEWFARLAVEDPWRLSRERAVAALGRAGARLGAGAPIGLAKDQIPAGPEAISTAIASLLKSARPMLENGAASAREDLDLDAACQVIEDLTLDLSGARRALRACVDLASARAMPRTSARRLERLGRALQVICVRQALSAALSDKQPLVRAAAVQAAVTCAGKPVLDPMLLQLAREPAPEVVTRVLRIVAAQGLPDPPSDLDPSRRDRARDAWLQSIYRLVENRPESAVRVGAMQALAAVSGAGFASLREEDWQAWWKSYREARVSADKGSEVRQAD